MSGFVYVLETISYTKSKGNVPLGLAVCHRGKESVNALRLWWLSVDLTAKGI